MMQFSFRTKLLGFGIALSCLTFAVLPTTARSQAADTAWQSYGGGVNILDNDPIWTDPAKSGFRFDMMQTIKKAGFEHVRVNLRAFAHMDDDNRLDPKWLSTLDKVVHEASAAGLGVILDEHDYRPCGADAEMCRTKLLAFWGQIAPRYADAPKTVMFEILNEPDRKMTEERWNALLADALALIRTTNPTRTVVVGPAHSNNPVALKSLVLPKDDRNLLVTIHYYNPFPFTHQGATWTTPSREKMTGVAWGSEEDKQAVKADFDAVEAWSKANGRPILVGEFGAYDKGDMAMRAAWATTVAKEAQRHGFAWSWWQFANGFDLYNVKSRQWVAPLKDALMQDAI